MMADSESTPLSLPITFPSYEVFNNTTHTATGEDTNAEEFESITKSAITVGLCWHAEEKSVLCTLVITSKKGSLPGSGNWYNCGRKHPKHPLERLANAT
jgi:hypothetical protein